MAVPQDLAELLESGAHFGHQARRWNPRMKPYIYGERDGVHVFDLTITARLLDEACEVVKNLVKEGKTVVFVGTKRQAKAIVKEEALRVGAPFVTERWMGGMITNWDEISKRLKKLKTMQQKWNEGGYDSFTKMERVLINREIERLKRFFGGVADLNKIPDALFIVDTIKEKVAVAEANTRGVKMIAIVDSNANPDEVDHVIPANDDAVRSLKYIVTRVADAYAEGKSARDKAKPAAAPTQTGKNVNSK